jgi:hypothetical protein
MTTTVDQKHRAVIPFRPGDVLEIEQQSLDVVPFEANEARGGRQTHASAQKWPPGVRGRACHDQRGKKTARGFPVILPDANLPVAFTWQNHQHNAAAERFFRK